MSAVIAPAREPALLKPAVLWLLLLAPLFFSTYGFATWVTSQRDDVGTLVFAPGTLEGAPQTWIATAQRRLAYR